MIKVTVKCVGCGNKKDVGEEQKEQPMCPKCYMPMIVVKATLQKDTRMKTNGMAIKQTEAIVTSSASTAPRLKPLR